MSTLLDFEDLAPGTEVTAQYGSRGVVFDNHVIVTDPAAHSGAHVLMTINPAQEVFEPLTLGMTFTSSQARVKFFAASLNVALNGTLIAFDAANNVVAQDGPKLVAADVFTTMFEVIDLGAVPHIARAELHLETGVYFSIDDLEFDGEAPPPPPPEPVVEITSPLNGAELDVSSIDILGTVTGAGLLSIVKLTMEYGQPPESTAPPFTSDLSLTGTGNTRQFSLPDFSIVPLGPVTITVTATNSGGLTGTGSVTFNNLPVPIRDRFGAEGGAASFGTFGFGLFMDGCKIAVYELGAISVDEAAVTRTIRGEIFTKWLSLRGPFEPDGIGCPLEEERDGPGGSRAQSFQKGRIYSHSTLGTFFVPAVFVNAIDIRGGEAMTGIPIMDPTSSSGVMETWLFQRFMRPDRPNDEPSTLEIRGTPPVLWMERQGGDLTYHDVKFSATLWESFLCDGPLGPCTVDPPAPTPEPISDAGGKFCLSTRYPLGAMEWSPILGHYISTPLFGLVRDSKLAGEDNPFSHEEILSCDNIIPGTLGIGCPSDWNVSVLPIGPQRGIAPYTSILAENTYVELEYEWREYYPAMLFFDDPYGPEIGDLIFAAGRWIIDCGLHGINEPYRSELHPVFMFAKMKMAHFEGHLATRADVWVNGWYPGDPIEFDIFPPPRPSPDAILVLSKPVDAEAGVDVNVEFNLTSAPDSLGKFNLAPSAVNHVHVKFTASLRECEVEEGDPFTDPVPPAGYLINRTGEMFIEGGRGYRGKWFLFWSTQG
jgi:hypothetical protein